MSKKIIAVSLVLILFGTLGAFAYEKKSKDIPVLATFDQPGHLNLSASLGYSWWGLGASVGAELNIGEFDIGPFPLAWGVAARGILGFGLGYGLSFGAGGLAQFHSGFDLGSSLKFEYYIGLGIGAFMEFGYALGFGLAQSAGFVWIFSDSFALLIENVDIENFLGYGYYYYAGVGVLLKL